MNTPPKNPEAAQAPQVQQTQPPVLETPPQGANQQANVKPSEKPTLPQPANYVRQGVRPPGDNGTNPAYTPGKGKAPEKK